MFGLALGARRKPRLGDQARNGCIEGDQGKVKPPLQEEELEEEEEEEVTQEKRTARSPSELS